MEKAFGTFIDEEEFLVKLLQEMNITGTKKTLITRRLKGLPVLYQTWGYVIAGIPDILVKRMINDDGLAGHICLQLDSGEKVFLGSDYLETKDYKKMSDNGFKYTRIILASQEAVKNYIDKEYYLNLPN